MNFGRPRPNLHSFRLKHAPYSLAFAPGAPEGLKDRLHPLPVRDLLAALIKMLLFSCWQLQFFSRIVDVAAEMLLAENDATF